RALDASPRRRRAAASKQPVGAGPTSHRAFVSWPAADTLWSYSARYANRSTSVPIDALEPTPMTDLFRRALAAAALAAGGFAVSLPAFAQVSPSELVVRIERLENQIRQLTGALEQVQFRNQQLEQQIRRMEEAELSKGGTRPAGPAPAAARPLGAA